MQEAYLVKAEHTCQAIAFLAFQVASYLVVASFQVKVDRTFQVMVDHTFQVATSAYLVEASYQAVASFQVVTSCRAVASCQVAGPSPFVATR